MKTVANLEDLVDPDQFVGYSMLAEDGKYFVTSDIDLASYLCFAGHPLKGTFKREFTSRGKKRIKIIMGFENNEDLWKSITEWEGYEGRIVRGYKTEYRRLIDIVNVRKDIR